MTQIAAKKRKKQERLPTQVTVAEVDGTTGSGPLNTTRVTLLPMEVQILRI